MPTYKEISALKSELLDARERKIKRKLSYQQEQMFDSLIDDFVKIAQDKVDGKKVDIYKLQSEIKKQYSLYFPEVMAEVVKASDSITNLNERYFSTLVDSNRLGEIQDKTFSIINKTLGVKDDGKLITGGFIDKVIENKGVQKLFTKNVTAILQGNPDIGLMKHKLKEFITGSKESTGLLERHYRTFANDLISNIDRTGSLVYANELELNHFYYSGGIILSSRSFCKSKNGKIFTRAEAERWKDSAFITSMYTNKSDYEPLIDMGGYGCRHRPDWVTIEVAKAKKKK